jgi:hypothetical protein
MSYAVLELSVFSDERNSDKRNPDPRRLRLGPGARATEGTSVHDKFLGKASESQIEDYFDWVSSSPLCFLVHLPIARV